MATAPSGTQELDSHLSRISTHWTAFLQAHADGGDASSSAIGKILQRYQRAVYRYLLASLRNTDAADEVFQEFALKLVRGDFRRADAQRGRWRHFLKSSLYHLMVDHHRRQGRQPLGLSRDDDLESRPPAATDLEDDAAFLTTWKAELLDNAWAALLATERETGQPLFAVLRYRTDHPEARSQAMAVHFSNLLGKPVTAGWIRKRLHVAREKFADLIVAEAARSLDDPDHDRIAEELSDLGLLDYCKDALDRWQAR